MNKRFKISLIISSVVVIGLIALGIFNYVVGIDKDVVDIVVAPKDTMLVLDSDKIIKPGKHKLATGKHTIKASRQDFEEQTKEFTATNGEENIIWFEMIPTNQTGIEYKASHESDFQNIYEIANDHVVEEVTSQTNNYPLIKYLPVSTRSIEYNNDELQQQSYYSDEKFVINYGQSKQHPYDNSKLAIYIAADHPAGKYTAINYIYNLGFDPSDYEIVFETTTSSSIDEGTGIGDSYKESLDNEPFPKESEYIIE